MIELGAQTDFSVKCFKYEMDSFLVQSGSWIERGQLNEETDGFPRETSPEPGASSKTSEQSLDTSGKTLPAKLVV